MIPNEMIPQPLRVNLSLTYPWIFGLLLVVAFPARAFSAEDLPTAVKNLIDNYGAESVARELQRQEPAAETEAAKTKIPADSVASESKQPDTLFGFFVRRSYSDVTSEDDPSVTDPADSRDKARPAQLSFTRDYLTESNEWSAVAAVIRPFKLYSNPQDPNNAPHRDHIVLDLVNFVPSISLDRESNSRDHTKDVDSLIFRAGTFARFSGGPFLLMDFRGYASYATSTQINGGIIAGELEWEPTTSIPGNRAFYNLIAPAGPRDRTVRQNAVLAFRWRGYLHSEFGGHSGAAFEQNGVNDFVRIGPMVEFTLDPLFSAHLTASINYGYLEGIRGTPASSHHLVANLGYILDSLESRHWTLNASYEEGESPLVQQPVKQFVLSLGVKY
jgi:hypothetical protein